jgi:hypothetical protein
VNSLVPHATCFDAIPRLDGHLAVFGKERVLGVQYDTPYVRNLPIRLFVTEANGAGAWPSGRRSMRKVAKK